MKKDEFECVGYDRGTATIILLKLQNQLQVDFMCNWNAAKMKTTSITDSETRYMANNVLANRLNKEVVEKLNKISQAILMINEDKLSKDNVMFIDGIIGDLVRDR